MLLTTLLILALTATASATPTVYLIRHGEKPADGGDGLTIQGQQRAQCLRTVFGNASQYNIGKILAQTPKANGKRTRPLLTVQPVAADLGITVDTSCDRDDPDCVADAVAKFEKKGSGKNVLVCWEHDALSDIVGSLGMKKPLSYPDESFNLIWTDPKPYKSVTAVTSENCPGLD
ncbi:phosphoglycerate mutase family protein, putative [Glarea lozoyensis ATCC 20868]|uniref:Phosphoglycerate mutase family protein, putative n=1 Tax=Glarea lozoyensis (strain ATCC 20868 / MF5171) TaxID=1116229 RepID=S3CLR2_GLAL2|nr:phosphoglycerate mutase family protein, putative [Glarea lozoyensis ATCC 20868]EPE27432.1 phosphoglycerate mutase family protein, putative [Glarea lozoyensis ATCC 20868]